MSEVAEIFGELNFRKCHGNYEEVFNISLPVSPSIEELCSLMLPHALWGYKFGCKQASESPEPGCSVDQWHREERTRNSNTQRTSLAAD